MVTALGSLYIPIIPRLLGGGLAQEFPKIEGPLHRPPPTKTLVRARPGKKKVPLLLGNPKP